MPPDVVCPLTSGVIEDEIVTFVGEGVMLKNKNIYMSMNEFLACDLANGVIIRVHLAEGPKDEQKLPKSVPKLKKLEPTDVPNTKPFFDSDYEKPDYKLTLEPLTMVASTVQEQPEQNTFDLPVEGIMATVAMALAVLQQVKQKKNDVESKKCCTESKVKFTEYDTKIEKLNKKIDESAQKESKAIHAEMYEQYKELKEMREDANGLKEVVSNLIELVKHKKS